MSGQTCTCGSRFMDAEDFRDHLPCPGSPEEQAHARGRREMLAEVLLSLRNPMDYKGSLFMEVANGLAWAADYLEDKYGDEKKPGMVKK
jgi:hypothetical protein